jgi:hypothetical protein
LFYLLIKIISMRKALIITAIAGLVFIYSCKKNNSSTGNWTFMGVSYSATSAAFSTLADSNVVLTASTSASSPSSLAITFLSQPVTGGTYQVVNYTTALGANQLFVGFTNGSTSFSYYSTGNDNVTAKVTVSSAGKVSVALPPVYLFDYANPTPDSAQVAGTIRQQ